MKKIILTTLMLLVSPACLSANLLTTYQLAETQDPVLQIAKAKLAAQQQNIPISRADLLPSIAGNATYTRNSDSSFSNISNQNTSFNLSLQQSLINLNQWYQFNAAKINTQSAEQTYLATVQQLIVRSAQAYFDVLQAEENLRINTANRLKLKKNYQQALYRFKAGLAKTSDVDNAQAAYDGSLNAVVSAKNTLITKRATLTSITGRSLGKLARLTDNIPMIKPKPDNLTDWLAKIAHYNLTVNADRLAAKAQQQIIRANNANHLPSLSANLGYAHNINNAVELPSGNSMTGSVNLNLPIFSGGQVSAQARQAAAVYAEDIGTLNNDYQQAVLNVKTNFNLVNNSLTLLKADQQAITSYQRAYHSTLIAYRAGLANTSIDDVLNAQQKIYQAELTYSQDKYQYILALLKLKQAAGVLSLNDLIAINHWLVN